MVLARLDKFRTWNSVLEKLRSRWTILRHQFPQEQHWQKIAKKQTNKQRNFQLNAFSLTLLGFLGHVRRARVKVPLTPQVFNSSRLIEAYLDFLKVGFCSLKSTCAAQFRVTAFILTCVRCHWLLKIIVGIVHFFSYKRVMLGFS